MYRQNKCYHAVLYVKRYTENKYSPQGRVVFAGNQDSNSVLIPVTSEDTSGK